MLFLMDQHDDSKGMLCSFSSGSFEIAEAENVSRGTKVVIHLKEDQKNFSLNTVVEGQYEIIKRRVFLFYTSPYFVNMRVGLKG